MGQMYPDRGIAVITGASTGIGFELARCAAIDGYDLVIAADEPEIHDAAALLNDHGVSIRAVEADLSTPEGIARLVDVIDDDGARRELLALLEGLHDALRGIADSIAAQHFWHPSPMQAVGVVTLEGMPG